MIQKEIGSVIKLLPKSAAAGLTPIKISNTKIIELEKLTLTSISAYKGKSKNLSEQLKKSHGLALPHYGRATGREGSRALWFGRQTLLVGPKCDEKLTKFAMLTDQSDAWVVLRMSGDLMEAVLMRLSPVDVRLKTFKTGSVVRTSLNHVNVTMHRIGANTIDVYGFRSMAKTLCHELTQALTTVAARD